jgi:DNA-binding NtrC family response regulator
MLMNTLQPDHTPETVEQLRAENCRLKRMLHVRVLQEIVGNSTVIQTLRHELQAAADGDRPVLVRGEPGTGTCLAAQVVHACSRRAHRPFLRFDCGVLSAESLERELCGEPLAGPQLFDPTAPVARGAFAHADGGTVFLDNVEQIALPLQKKLAAVLLSLEADARGDSQPTGVRVIAATHVDLRERLRKCLFREELYPLVTGVEIAVPPLREYREDVGLLTECFLNRLALKEGRPARRIAVDVIELFQQYDWPGNVRELQSAIARACELDNGTWLTAEMVRPWLTGELRDAAGEVEGMTLKEMERRLIETTFARCDGNRERTARTLRIGLRTLSGKLREYGYPPRGGPGSNVAREERRAA